MFAYGFLAVVLVLYLRDIGLSEKQAGLLLTLTLVGDTAISFWLTTHADRLGRRRMLLVGSALMFLAGVAFLLSHNFLILLAAATIGVISPSGYEVGPFLAIEQAALTQVVPAILRTRVLAWYNLAGSLATALGSLAGGALAAAVGLRAPVAAYSAFGLALAVLFLRLSGSAEAPFSAPKDSFFGLHRSRGVVVKLAAMFSLDAFAGGFVVQSMLAYWFHVRFGVDAAALGGIFFGANLLAAFSALAAGRLAAR
jgi:predicted MFS family arabinose efflux permease